VPPTDQPSSTGADRGWKLGRRGNKNISKGIQSEAAETAKTYTNAYEVSEPLCPSYICLCHSWQRGIREVGPVPLVAKHMKIPPSKENKKVMMPG